MADWDPDLYHKFRRYRAEPFEAIVARLDPHRSDERVIDLGCGTGEYTVALARRLAASGHTVGIDSSPAMIERAASLRRSLEPALRERLRFELGDVRRFAAHREYSTVFSNAVFQWLDDHPGIFARCFEALTPGGRMVVQMPANDHETAQVTLDTLAHEEPWRAPLEGVRTPTSGVAKPEAYSRMLAEIGFKRIDCYFQTFRHRMVSPAEIVEWCRATVLRRYLDRLPPDARVPFTAAFAARLGRAYGTSGPLVFNFRRLFIWAHRPCN
jgi:trans-aconitate 2-methyltransferase